ncbi:MAG: hypothetical protein ACOCRK_02155 [bacterium]
MNKDLLAKLKTGIKVIYKEIEDVYAESKIKEIIDDNEETLIILNNDKSFMLEDNTKEIYFAFNCNVYLNIEGQIFCNNCKKLLDCVQETQYDYIKWKFKDGEYIRTFSVGDSDGKKCPHCKSQIYDDYNRILDY